jgi:hypothetical protein
VLKLRPTNTCNLLLAVLHMVVPLSRSAACIHAVAQTVPAVLECAQHAKTTTCMSRLCDSSLGFMDWTYNIRKHAIVQVQMQHAVSDHANVI